MVWADSLLTVVLFESLMFKFKSVEMLFNLLLNGSSLFRKLFSLFNLLKYSNVVELFLISLNLSRGLISKSSLESILSFVLSILVSIFSLVLSILSFVLSIVLSILSFVLSIDFSILLSTFSKLSSTYGFREYFSLKWSSLEWRIL